MGPVHCVMYVQALAAFEFHPELACTGWEKPCIQAIECTVTARYLGGRRDAGTPQQHCVNMRARSNSNTRYTQGKPPTCSHTHPRAQTTHTQD